jgi:hypothetical protein
MSNQKYLPHVPGQRKLRKFPPAPSKNILPVPVVEEKKPVVIEPDPVVTPDEPSVVISDETPVEAPVVEKPVKRSKKKDKESNPSPDSAE